jgi:hypothetical protein
MTVTESTRNALRLYIQTVYTKMDIGEGGGSTDMSNDSLDVSITSALGVSKITATVSSSNDNQVEYTCTVNGATYTGYTIREVGIFNTAGDTMLSRIPIDPIGPMLSNKTYEITVILEVE